MLACNLNRLSPFQCIQWYGTLCIIITTSWVAHETGSGHPPLLGRDLDHLSCHHSPIRIPGFSYLVDGAIQCPKLITIQHKPDRDFWYSTATSIVEASKRTVFSNLVPSKTPCSNSDHLPLECWSPLANRAPSRPLRSFGVSSSIGAPNTSNAMISGPQVFHIITHSPSDCFFMFDRETRVFCLAPPPLLRSSRRSRALGKFCAVDKISLAVLEDASGWTHMQTSNTTSLHLPSLQVLQSPPL